MMFAQEWQSNKISTKFKKEKCALVNVAFDFT